MRAVFYRKEPEIEANEFCVEKVIVLPAGEYESFTKHLMHDYDFIRDMNLENSMRQDAVQRKIRKSRKIVIVLPF